MAPHGTIIGQLQTATGAQTSTATATPPTAISQVTASPTQLHHLQTAQSQQIAISQPQQVPLPPTAVSPPKEVENNPPLTVADSQGVPEAVEILKEDILDGNYNYLLWRKVL